MNILFSEIDFPVRMLTHLIHHFHRITVPTKFTNRFRNQAFHIFPSKSFMTTDVSRVEHMGTSWTFHGR
jgi:hypothetical protein